MPGIRPRWKRIPRSGSSQIAPSAEAQRQAPAMAAPAERSSHSPGTGWRVQSCAAGAARLRTQELGNVCASCPTPTLSYACAVLRCRGLRRATPNEDVGATSICGAAGPKVLRLLKRPAVAIRKHQRTLAWSGPRQRATLQARHNLELIIIDYNLLRTLRTLGNAWEWELWPPRVPGRSPPRAS